MLCSDSVQSPIMQRCFLSAVALMAVLKHSCSGAGAGAGAGVGAGAGAGAGAGSLC